MAKSRVIVFAYIETADLVPNLQTYNVLIKMSCKKKQFAKAKEHKV